MQSDKKILGIVVEYNPFHLGHLYQIEAAKAASGAEYVIVIMSGHFVQRGEAAIYKPKSRARMALSAGVDAVYEMPAAFSTASAADFAYYAVNFLHAMSVDYISFGVEGARLDELDIIAKSINDDKSSYHQNIKELCAKGLSYPIARKEAILSEICQYDIDRKRFEYILSTPNNILAIEYISSMRALNSGMIPILINREGAGYNDNDIHEASYSSASSIRKYILKGGDLSKLSSALFPEHIDFIKGLKPLSCDDFKFSINRKLYELYYKSQNLSIYSDISRELSDRIYKCNDNYSDYESMLLSIKTKQYTYSRISRALIHILLDITKEDISSYKVNIKYARLLGFKKSSCQLLSILKKRSSLINITKLSHAYKLLKDEPVAYKLLMGEVYSGYIYNSVYFEKYGDKLRNPYEEELVII